MKISDELLLEEFKSLRGQIDYQVKDLRDLERYSIAGIAILFSWIIANIGNLNQIPAMWFLPLIIPVMAWLRSNAVAKKINQLSIYVGKIEQHIYRDSINGINGWESEIINNKKHRSGLDVTRKIFWLITSFITFSISLIGYMSI